ncbi:hypothetical protein LTR27_011409 [Elasticomyces elasticus]|nr:hypothetical protein LTR27_011409 [Elasticomyces elasticus]
MDSSYEHMDLRSAEERLRIVRLQIEEAKLMSIVQRLHDVPASRHPDPSCSQSAALVQAESQNTSGIWARDVAMGSQPMTGPFDVLVSTPFGAIPDQTLAVTDACADLDSCMAISNHTSTVDLQQDMMATNVGPNYTPLMQTGDHCEPEPVDWSWLTDFTAELSSSTQYRPPNDRAGIRSDDHPINCSVEGGVPNVGINYGIGMGQTLQALPASPHPRAEGPVNELRTVVSLDSGGKGRGVLQEYPANSKRRKTSNIPGYSCFSIVQEGMNARRQTPRAMQEDINKLRKRGACMLCRIRNVKCSLEDPCTECQRLVDRAKSGAAGVVSLSPCLRSFTEVDPFQYLRNTEFSYVTTTKPHWSRWATGRPDGYDSLKAIKLLAIAYSVNNKAGQDAKSASLEVYPAKWSHFASDVLGLVDGFIRCKKFWEDRNSSLILAATMDLLMGICLDMALHIQELSECHIVFEDARIYSALVERCKFCVRKVMSFRKIMLPRLDTTESSYFEEAALATLSKVTPRSQVISQAMEVLSDMRMHVYRIDRCLSSKELLLLQSLHLGDTELIGESLSQGAHPYHAREAHHYRLGAMDFALERRKEDVLKKLIAAAWEFERRREATLQADDEAPQRPLEITRRKLMVYALEKRRFDMLHNAHALSGGTSDAGNALCLAVPYELDTGPIGFPTINAVLNAGADVNVRNASGFTALMVAVKSSSPTATQCAELLLARGADVNARARDGSNVATIAIDHGLKHLYLLVAYGVSLPDYTHYTHRHTTVGDCVSLMLRHMEMSFCSGPWTSSASTGANDVVCLLLDYGTIDDSNELRVTWWRADEAEARLLLERAADDYSEALQAASAEGHEVVVWTLSNSVPTGYSHSNAIRAASATAHETVARLLLAKGVETYRKVLEKAFVGGDGVAVRALLEGVRHKEEQRVRAEVPLLLTVLRPVTEGALLRPEGHQHSKAR